MNTATYTHSKSCISALQELFLSFDWLRHRKGGFSGVNQGTAVVRLFGFFSSQGFGFGRQIDGVPANQNGPCLFLSPALPRDPLPAVNRIFPVHRQGTWRARGRVCTAACRRARKHRVPEDAGVYEYSYFGREMVQSWEKEVKTNGGGALVLGFFS